MGIFSSMLGRLRKTGQSEAVSSTEPGSVGTGKVGGLFRKLTGQGSPSAPSKIGSLFGRILRRTPEAPAVVPQRPPEPEPAPAPAPEPQTETSGQGEGIPPEFQDEWLLGGQWQNVASSNVEKIRYDYDEQALHVGFLSGSEYAYAHVPPEVALAMAQYPSPGRFVWRFLRDVYEYRRLVHGTKPTPRLSPRNRNVVRPRRDLDPPERRKEFQIEGVRHLVSKWRVRRP